MPASYENARRKNPSWQRDLNRQANGGTPSAELDHYYRREAANLRDFPDEPITDGAKADLRAALAAYRKSRDDLLNG